MKQKIQLKALEARELANLVVCLANLMTKQMSYIELFD